MHNRASTYTCLSFHPLCLPITSLPPPVFPRASTYTCLSFHPLCLPITSLPPPVFPAGILQPPFYHPAFPRSLNYGGIGVVIGHEITHGFDDRGRQFDKNGNLQQWWTPSDVSQFYQRASCMLDQYGEYEVDEVGLKINPVNTLGENIADNAGIKISYQAYQNWRKNNEETVMLPYVNLTHDQLFFLNFGQIWCEINSPEAMLTKIRSGQHSPNRFRQLSVVLE
ncbi:Neprilysin-4 [Chionoecetes opilio]|uniref:Neprilysin-4 n=1 Tax=Chionoecetes opilio TaxID=41210 RepID=A0A8J4XPW5_CHIOP|nr:Neprilysin-4 [Chionoecetes opilio]